MRTQILGSVGAEEADLEETPDHAGQNLICSRKEAWDDVMLRHAIEHARRYDSLRQRVDELVGTSGGGGSGGAAGPGIRGAAGVSGSNQQQQQPQVKKQQGGSTEDYHVLAKLILEESRERLERERKRPMTTLPGRAEEEAAAEEARKRRQVKLEPLPGLAMAAVAAGGLPAAAAMKHEPGGVGVATGPAAALSVFPKMEPVAIAASASFAVPTAVPQRETLSSAVVQPKLEIVRPQAPPPPPPVPMGGLGDGSTNAFQVRAAKHSRILILLRQCRGYMPLFSKCFAPPYRFLLNMPRRMVWKSMLKRMTTEAYEYH